MNKAYILKIGSLSLGVFTGLIGLVVGVAYASYAAVALPALIFGICGKFLYDEYKQTKDCE